MDENSTETIGEQPPAPPPPAAAEETHDPAPLAAPLAAPDRLRAFEDALFGADAVRIGGRVERGFGSKFKEMTGPQVRHYAALEKVVSAEQALADAHAALIDAEAAHQAALANADKTEAGLDGHE